METGRKLFKRKGIAVTMLFFLLIIQSAIAQPPRLDPDTLILPLAASEITFKYDSVDGIVVNESGMRAGLLYDYNAKKIVWQKDLHYVYPIASLTKMMVALLVMEDINNCKVDWNDEIVMARQLVKRVRRKKVRYTVQETYTLDALFRLAMIASHNEACNSIAKYLDGSIESFMSRMNARARELNMNDTYFSTPSGLPSGKRNLDNSSSPHDLLLLTLEMIQYPEILSVTKIGYADISNNKASGIYRNHNHLVIDYENEVDGMKTGYTKNARFCLAATSSRSNHRLVSIVLGVRNPYERNNIVADMMSNYYERIGVGRLTGNLASASLKDKDESDTIQAVSGETVVYKTVWIREKKYHLIRGGETLSGIADKYNCTISSIKKWNRMRTTKVIKGNKLLVYTNVKKKVAIREDQIQKDDSGEENPEENATVNASGLEKESFSSADQPKKKSVNEKLNYFYHVVLPGETLWKIAQQYEETVERIKKLNNITNAKSLKAGTKLKIKANS